MAFVLELNGEDQDEPGSKLGVWVTPTTTSMAPTRSKKDDGDDDPVVHTRVGRDRAPLLAQYASLCRGLGAADVYANAIAGSRFTHN